MSIWRWLTCFALLCAARPARAIDVAANLEVTAMSGREVVFKGYTDERGRFETTPLPPGVYIFQLRIPKMMITPARYSLALSGARPVGDALVGPGVALAMNAEVRRLTAVKGQASGRRVMLVPAPAASIPGPPASVAASSTRTSNASSASPMSGNTPATSWTPRRATVATSTTTNGSRRAMPLTPPRQATAAPAATLSRPATTNPAVLTAPASVPTAATTSAAAAHPPRIINGQLYIWVPSAPGSSVGHWLPEAAVSRSTRAAAQAPSPTPPHR